MRVLRRNLCASRRLATRFWTVPLAKVGGKGLFTKEIEEALLENRADLAVHSMKDVPAVVPDGLTIRAILKREDPRDAAATITGGDLSSLPGNARIGTSSLRRICQIKARHPDFEFISIRGNVQTRLNKLGGEVDAVILAAAGVIRLGIAEKMHLFFDAREILPAVAQGAIGVETRSDDERLHTLVDVLNHDDDTACVLTERSFLARLEGGCQVPIAGHATLIAGNLYLEGLVGEVDGSKIIRKHISGPRTEAVNLGRELADELLEAGGKSILDKLYSRQP